MAMCGGLGVYVSFLKKGILNILHVSWEIHRNPTESQSLYMFIHGMPWDAMGFLRMLGDAMGFHKSLCKVEARGRCLYETNIIEWDVMGLTMGCPGMPVIWLTRASVCIRTWLCVVVWGCMSLFWKRESSIYFMYPEKSTAILQNPSPYTCLYMGCHGIPQDARGCHRIP